MKSNTDTEKSLREEFEKIYKKKPSDDLMGCLSYILGTSEIRRGICSLSYDKSQEFAKRTLGEKF